LEGEVHDSTFIDENSLFILSNHSYQLSIIREFEDNSALLDLEIEGCHLRPYFHKDLFAYACYVSFDILKVNIITAEVAHIFEKEDIQGQGDNLIVGQEKTILINVTAQNNIDFSVYTVRITRLEQHRAYLNDLTVTIDPKYKKGPVRLEPLFSSHILEYKCIVEQRVAEVDLNWTLGIGSLVSIGGHEMLVDGDNRVEVVVTAKDNISTTHYVINVVRGDDNAELWSLNIDGCDMRSGKQSINKVFDSRVTFYHCYLVLFSMGDITYQTVNQNAQVQIVGYDNGFEGLQEGTNIISIHVTAENERTVLVYQILLAKNIDTFNICERQSSCSATDCQKEMDIIQGKWYHYRCPYD